MLFRSLCAYRVRIFAIDLAVRLGGELGIKFGSFAARIKPEGRHLAPRDIVFVVGFGFEDKPVARFRIGGGTRHLVIADPEGQLIFRGVVCIHRNAVVHQDILVNAGCKVACIDIFAGLEGHFNGRLFFSGLMGGAGDDLQISGALVRRAAAKILSVDQLDRFDQRAAFSFFGCLEAEQASIPQLVDCIGIFAAVLYLIGGAIPFGKGDAGIQVFNRDIIGAVRADFVKYQPISRECQVTMAVIRIGGKGGRSEERRVGKECRL